MMAGIGINVSDRDPEFNPWAGRGGHLLPAEVYQADEAEKKAWDEYDRLIEAQIDGQEVDAFIMAEKLDAWQKANAFSASLHHRIHCKIVAEILG